MPSRYSLAQRRSPSNRASSLALSLATLAALATAQTTEAKVFAADRVIVELSPSLEELPETIDLKTAFAGDPTMQIALAASRAQAMYRVFRSGGVKPRDPQLFHTLGMDRQYVVDLAAGSDVDAAQRAFQAAPSVVSTRLDGVVHTTETPNDPLFPNQWDHRNANDADMDTDLAWDVSKSDPSVIVAIVDTGCDLTHPEIASALLPGYNFVSNNNNPQDDHGHGTCCAGIAGARSNNGQGIAGVAPQCSLLPVKVLNSSGFGSYSAVAAGISFSANSGASVVSMSLAGPCCDSGVESALQYAASLDVLCVAASGNNNSLGVLYPASSPWGMAVGASSPCDERKNPSSCDGEGWGSTFGPELDVIAPGVQIPTITWGGGTTLGFNGTSAATPHVAGIAALLRSIDPAMSYADVRSLIEATAQDQVGPPAEDTPGFDIYFGYGRVNAHRAALAAMGSTTFCFADGAGAPPPCGNTGGYEVGARNSTGVGALLNASGSNSVGMDDLALHGSQLPANRPTLFLMGAGANSGGNGSPFYDGLLCIAAGGVGIFRHPPQISSAGGTVELGPGIANYSCSHFAGLACFQPGARWNFQVWFRDQAGPCSTGANLSNGLGVTFRP